MSLTMQQTAAMLGLPRVRHCRRCKACGGLLIERYVERRGRNAYLRDFERLAWVCEECGEEAEA